MNQPWTDPDNRPIPGQPEPNAITGWPVTVRQAMRARLELGICPSDPPADDA